MATNPTNPPTPIPAPAFKGTPPATPSGPSDITVPAGKTFILLNGTTVMLLKSVTADTRIFTNWVVNQYPDLATAQSAITTNKWSYTTPTSPAK